jgi:hypothetical protein
MDARRLSIPLWAVWIMTAFSPAWAEPPAKTLCTASERPIFACPIGNRLVSVCAPRSGPAIYRYGRNGRIELEARDVRRAERATSGGGEDQLWFDRGGYRYILYSRTVRTGFADDGHADADFSAGLVVQQAGRSISDRRCGGSGDQTIDGTARQSLPKGDFIPH